MSRFIRSWAIAPLALALLPGGARAFRGEREARQDAKRFGLDRPEPAARRVSAPRTPQAVVRLDQLRARGARVRYAPSGAVAAVMGPIPTRAGTPEQAARGFLDDYADALAIDTRELTLELERDTDDGRHLLFSQTHRGVPVEFSRVKVHLNASGDVIALHSSYQRDIQAGPTPGVDEAAAAAAVARDLGTAAPSGGQLVYVPVYATGEARLAWRFQVNGDRARWRYYVDAQTNAVLFRFDDLRRFTGKVHGYVYAIDPNQTPGQYLPFAHEKVWVGSGGASFTTGADGSFNTGATAGKIYGGLRGAYVNVGHFTRDPVHFDNGSGHWFTAATPVSSPAPYSNGSRYPTSTVYSVDLTAPAPGSLPAPFTSTEVVVGSMINFQTFRVGSLGPDGEIADDDQVHVYNSAGDRVASYLGNRSPFKSAAVYGATPLVRLQISANQSGQEPGFTVNISSYLVLTNPDVTAGGTDPNHIVWASTMTADGTNEEINVFYHLNKMHDYFVGGVDKSSMVWISSPVAAMTHFGPNLANAFFNPDHNNFGFGDYPGISLDATVIHHEYVHYVIDKIYPILNFGQNGAISEGLADYFSASSLGVSSIGKYVGGQFGESALRELDCGANPPCKLFPNDWVGEIHDDSVPFSQALWELRAAAGQACTDWLVFKSLFYFADSFEEFQDAMILADAGGSSFCGAAGSHATQIRTKFASHMSLNLANAYEPNDGFQTATDITTNTVVSATIYPGADLDYYSFGSAAGPMRATLTLPTFTDGSHYAYGLILMDSRQQVLTESFPAIDVNPIGGYCPSTDCQTSQPTVTLDYTLPAAGQYYLVVSAAPALGFSNSATASTKPYRLELLTQSAGALSGSIVAASVVDRDTIDFTVLVSSFVTQNFTFDHAQLRDHNRAPIADTNTNDSRLLALVGTPTSADGKLTGQVRLQSFGGKTFTERYPSLGTVYLEVYAKNALQTGQAVLGSTAPFVTSMGFSPALNLTTTASRLTAYNNIFNPQRGERATFKYETLSAGHVRLRLFTLSGALVSTLVDADVPAGKGAVDWAGRNDSGTTVASGVYLLRLEGPGGLRSTQKVIVVK